jgi:type II secretory pathway component GspD/PulD (secretin)
MLITTFNDVTIGISACAMQATVAHAANATTLTPTISQQKVKSTVVVDNGQTVSLGGLISRQPNQEKKRDPEGG